MFVGINQAGLAECIVRSVQACHPYLQPVLFESIILTGGSTLFPRFTERLERELRSLVPDDYKIKIIRQEKYVSPHCVSRVSYTNAINAILLCLAQFSVFGEVDQFWRPALISNQCALQNQSMRRWDQQGAGKGFFTE
uniref:ARP906 n=1 Tax=Arundo donax TaxID=35708 RepID=A0A0A9GTL0_ARUDO